MTTAATRVAIAGSEGAAWPHAREVEPVSGDATVDVSLWLRPHRGGELDRARAAELGAALPARRRYAPRAALAAASDADPGDLAALRAYLSEHGIDVVETRWRSVCARGSLAAFSRAFEAQLSECVDDDGLRFRRRVGPLRVPAHLAEVVRGVFGLDTWPAVHSLKPASAPQAASGAAAHAQAASGAPPPAEMPQRAADAYEFPAGDGRGQTIGILSFGAFDRNDFATSLQSQRVALPEVVLVPVDGGVVAGAPLTPFDAELALDVQLAAALAPGAKFVLYGAPHDERGFLDAIGAALLDEGHRPSILSISYGRPECYWTRNALELLDELFVAAALLGVSVFCASGDQGAVEVDGKPRVFAPASSSFAHACGGSQVDIAGGRRNERSWPQSGGGFSERAGPPPWQSVASEQARQLHARHGRGVPDVAAQAFPPYRIVLRGRPAQADGTSAVAPLWAALTARLNERLGMPLGFYAPLLYAKAEEARLFRLATGEGNGRYPASAGSSWNPCTGLGVPRGTSLERALRDDVR